MNLQRPLNDLDGAVDAGTKPARLGEEDFHGSKMTYKGTELYTRSRSDDAPAR